MEIMNFVALKMLIGDRAKYLGILMGLTFASLLITQQLSIFVGLMGRNAQNLVGLYKALGGGWEMETRLAQYKPRTR
jgi:hypothetical protein